MNGRQQVIHQFGYVLMLCLVGLMVSSCGGDDDEAVPPPDGCTSNCPTADAGPDQAVLVGSQVTLDGSQSASGTPGLLTYQWTLTTKPAGSAAALAGATTVRPTFTADVAGTYLAQLVVDNGGVRSNADTVTITADTGNLPPIANAGPDVAGLLGRLITLDGTASSDPNGTPVTYAWQILTKPPASQAVLMNPMSATPSLTPDVAGGYRLSLTVSDGSLTSPPDEVEITAVASGNNVPPVADAGPDQQVTTGQLVTLSGAGSSDPNGGPLTYHWCLQSKPEGSTAALADPATANPSFTPDVAGFYVFCLSVNDGQIGSPFDMVVVEATRPATGQPGRFNGPVTAIIEALDDSGDVYVLGRFTMYNDEPVRPVVRLRPNGSLNSTFVLDSAIQSRTDVFDEITSIAAADDGSGDLYVGEVFQAGTYPIGSRRDVANIWKVNADGTVDSGFPTGEVTRTSPRDPLDFLRLHTIVPVGDGSGRVYVGGLFDSYNGTQTRGLVRLNSNGTLDATFTSSSGTGVFRVVPATDGSGDLYVVSYDRSDLNDYSAQHLYRLNQDGSRDPAFDAGQGVFTTFRDNTTINTVVLLEDGSGDLLIGGAFFTWSDGNPSGPNAVRNLARVNPDGTLDRTSPKPQVNEEEVVSLLANAVDGSGDIFVVHGTLTRHRPDGLLDPAFHSEQVPGGIRALLPMSDDTGDIYVGGSSLVRINRDGTLD